MPVGSRGSGCGAILFENFCYRHRMYCCLDDTSITFKPSLLPCKLCRESCVASPVLSTPSCSLRSRWPNARDQKLTLQIQYSVFVSLFMCQSGVFLDWSLRPSNLQHGRNIFKETRPHQIVYTVRLNSPRSGIVHSSSSL